MLTYLLLMLMACGASLVLTRLVRGVAVRVGAVDKPDGRKVHKIAIPRLGGVSVVLAVGLTTLAAIWLGPLQGSALGIDGWTPVLLGSAIVFVTGFWDDLRPLPAWLKFLFQAIAAGTAIWFGVRVDSVFALSGHAFNLGIFAVPLTLLWIVGLTNAFNLIDGLDGLATGLGLIAALTSATIFFLGGGQSEGLLLLILSGALAGFLFYNFYPATIFLGDSGSQVIGYVFAVTTITGLQKGSSVLSAIIPLLVFGLPIADTLLSIARRAFRCLKGSRVTHTTLKERMVLAKHIFKPDRDHVHHRLLAMGFPHRSAVLMLYAFAGGLSCLALLAVVAEYRNAGGILFAVGVATYIGIRKLNYEEVALWKIGTLLRWTEHIVFTRLSLLIMMDVMLVTAAYWSAFVLKYDGLAAPAVMQWHLIAFPCVLLIQMSVFFAGGLYRSLSRAMDIADLLHLSAAVATAVLLSHALSVVYEPPMNVWGFFGIDALFLLVIILGGRSAYRILVHPRHKPEIVKEGERVLIYGAGRRGEWIQKELLVNRSLKLCPVGFIEDDPCRMGLTINGLRVLGSSRDLAHLLDAWKISAVIVSSKKIGAERLAPVIGLCSKYQIAVLRADFHLDLLSGPKRQETTWMGPAYIPEYSRPGEMISR